jgi:hypothetical protein
MHRTGYESALWELAKQIRLDGFAAPGLVGLWFAGWLALVLTLFTPSL